MHQRSFWQPILAAQLLATGLAATLTACAGEPLTEPQSTETLRGETTALLAEQVAWSNEGAPHPQQISQTVRDEVARYGDTRVLVEFLDPNPAPIPGGVLDVAHRRLDPNTLQQMQDERAATRDKLVAELTAAGVSLNNPRFFDAFPVFALTVNAADLEILAANPNVLAVYPNRRAEPLAGSSAPYTGGPTLIARGADGAGTSVAILDTPVLLNNGAFGDCATLGAPNCAIDVRIDFAFSNGGSTDPRINTLASLEPHGSNVAGIVRAVAPATRLISLNVFVYESDGSGGFNVYTYTELEVAALDWVATNAAARSIVAANMSLGTDPLDNVPCNDDALYTVFATLVGTYGVIPVVSSGNGGSRRGIASPACNSSAFSVAASYDLDVNNDAARPNGYYEARGGVPSQVASFSDLSGMVDIAAPGVWVTAGGIEDYSGTSMAAPHVAGAIAVLQNDYRNTNGVLQNAYVVSRVLQYSAATAERDGAFFPQLLLRDRNPWDFGQLFQSFWGRETAANIPRTGAAFTRSITVSGAPTSIDGIYLPIEVIHPRPGDVEVRIVPPVGSVITFRLPTTGFSNFNDVIGRRWLPGTLSALAGINPNGTWRIEFFDRGALGGGRYLSAALLLRDAACTPNCAATDACGDNGCGGTCGACAASTFCHPDGQCRPNGSWCAGDSSAAPIAFTLEHGTNTLPFDLRECRSDANPSCGQPNGRDLFYSLTLQERSTLRIETSGFDTVLSASTPTGAALGCNDNRTLFDVTSRLELNDTTGSVRVAVDGRTASDAAEGTLIATVCYPSVCNDELFCNGQERCNVVSCTAGTNPCPAVSLACVQRCDETTDSCGVVLPGFCVIGGTCVAEGTPNPANPCQVCRSAVSSSSYTNNNGATCDDGLFCNGGGTCNAGTCVETSPPCPDVSATPCLDTCNEATDTCGQLRTGFCLIDGACYAAGATAPDRPCSACRPTRATNAWTQLETDCATPSPPDTGSDTDAGSDVEDATELPDTTGDVAEDADTDAHSGGADVESDTAEIDAGEDTDVVEADIAEDAGANTSTDADDSETGDDSAGDTRNDADAGSPDPTGDTDGQNGQPETDGSGENESENDTELNARSPAGCSAAVPAHSALLWASLAVLPLLRRRRLGSGAQSGTFR